MYRINKLEPGVAEIEGDKPHILFISHDSGLTGAPIFLLNFLRWLKVSQDLRFSVLLRKEGELSTSFEALAQTHYASPINRPKSESWARRVLGKLFKWSSIGEIGAHNKAILRFCREGKFAAIYANTITNGELLEVLSLLGLPVITHVHELAYWTEKAGQRNLELVKAHTTRYIAASHFVKQYLCENVGISSDIVDVVHEFISVSGAQTLCPVSSSLRGKLCIPDSALVVVGSGFETHRKGKDLFVQLAAEVRKLDPKLNCHFVWVGGWEDDNVRQSIEKMVQDNQLAGCISFVGQVNNPLEYFSAADVFTMVSREDPFPLVCLEAAAMSKPILCFASAGGMPEFVENDCGYVIPFLDVTEMARKIQYLDQNRFLLDELGKNAARKVKDRHDVAVGGPEIVRSIHKVLKK